MQEQQDRFIRFCLAHNVLRFGDFILKSGRCSPYFFNLGLFNSGVALAQLGQFYAAIIEAQGLAYDVVFGPAYKGIPLVSTVVIALAQQFQLDKPYCFNRKTVKDHGEGGQLVGAALTGRVLIVDDVITAGTAVNDSMQLIQAADATPAAIVIAMDRQEQGHQAGSAIQEIEQRYAIPVHSIIRLDDIIAYLQRDPQQHQHLQKIEQYRRKYGLQYD